MGINKIYFKQLLKTNSDTNTFTCFPFKFTKCSDTHRSTASSSSKDKKPKPEKNTY